jgi:hypothetical protein
MRTACLFSVFLLLPVCLFAQQDSTITGEEVSAADTFHRPDYDNVRAPFEIYPEVEITFPTGAFRSKFDGWPLGKGIGIYYRLKKYPVNIGLRFGDLVIDRMKRTIQDTLDGDNFPTDLREIVKSRVWIWYGAVRFEPLVRLPFQPYFEGAFGPQRFFTRRRLREAGISLSSDDDDSGDIVREALHSDWGWAFSGAAGIKISLYKNYLNSLDFQVGYRQGTSIEFHVKTGDSINVTDPLDNFELRESPVSMVFFKIGVSVMLFDALP